MKTLLARHHDLPSGAYQNEQGKRDKAICVPSGFLQQLALLNTVGNGTIFIELVAMIFV